MKAMVLCAGYGTRLGDLTRDTPKPMLRLQQRPMLKTLRPKGRHSSSIFVKRPELLETWYTDFTEVKYRGGEKKVHLMPIVNHKTK